MSGRTKATFESVRPVAQNAMQEDTTRDRMRGRESHPPASSKLAKARMVCQVAIAVRVCGACGECFMFMCDRARTMNKQLTLSTRRMRACRVVRPR